VQSLKKLEARLKRLGKGDLAAHAALGEQAHLVATPLHLSDLIKKLAVN
jgi:hypothetical protein